MKQRTELLTDALHVFVLCNFAIAQPLFDMLSQNAEFFVVRKSELVDVVLLILVLCIVIPTLVVSVEVVVGLFGRRVRKVVHVFVVSGLVAVIFLPVLKQIGEVTGPTLLAAATILGVAAAVGYMRFSPLRMFLTVMSPALLLFPGLFLFNSPVFTVISERDDPNAIYAEVDATAPIVFVVFDELGVTSLMDEHRQIDAIRYPNFAALAQDATWFRNLSTVSFSTLDAVPAILSGSYPNQPSLPTAAEYPNNLFTLLGGSYEMKVFESHTMICPDTICGKNKQHQTLAQRMHSLLLDLSIVYLHMVFPTDLTGGLPSVTQTWKDFWGTTNAFIAQPPDMNDVNDRGRASYEDRAGLFTTFVESIAITDKPVLYFLHILLPHVPWEYLPSGKVYTTQGWVIPGLDLTNEKWGENDWLVIQGYQRHLLQLGLVDKLVGDLLAQLKTVNLYDRSLIILTADHGVSFWPNESRRQPSPVHPKDVQKVPLFIKAPHQHEGVISDGNVKTIDILPTIADILGIKLPWSVDGHSAYDLSLLELKRKVNKQAKKRPVLNSAALEVKDISLERKLALFGSGAHGLFNIGPHNSLVGLHVDDVGVMGEADVVVELDNPIFYERVNLQAPFVPAEIKGSVRTSAGTDAGLDLAVAVNGTIQAVTRTYLLKTGLWGWGALVHEASFRPGKNDIEIFVVSMTQGAPRLARTKNQSTVTYSLSTSSNQRGEALISSDGTSMPVISNALGWLDVAVITNEAVRFTGWAADTENSELPEAIAIFVNGEFFYSGRTRVKRPDVVETYGNAALLLSGFDYGFPLWLFGDDLADAEIRVFAMFKNSIASELHYYKGYEWGKNP